MITAKTHRKSPLKGPLVHSIELRARLTVDAVVADKACKVSRTGFRISFERSLMKNNLWLSHQLHALLKYQQFARLKIVSSSVLPPSGFTKTPTPPWSNIMDRANSNLQYVRFALEGGSI